MDSRSACYFVKKCKDYVAGIYAIDSAIAISSSFVIHSKGLDKALIVILTVSLDGNT
ncbi:MAG: hypothetical protein JSV32_08050 [Dehalococcoidia bacterium]|nr:MAG: hypothetical protein JSV32_08050 [Dehalococcoidia bacterium]